MLVLQTTAQSVYDLTGKYRNIRVARLSTAKSLKDLVADYPSNWITAYKTVEITTVNKGIVKKSAGVNDILTAEQKGNLQTADLMTLINIKVNYVYKNPSSGQTENNNIHVSFYNAPEINAQFGGGYKEMYSYLKKSILGNEKDTIPARLGMVVVKFMVDEDGAVSNPQVVKSSGDLFTDSRLLQAVSKMPKWKPAADKGMKMKQQVQFSFGGC
jgi:protein TonB